MTRKVLQLCHDYHGPFVSVCRQYVEALSDSEVTTIFIQGEENEQVREGVGGHRVLFLQGDNLRGIKFSQIFHLNRLLSGQHFDVAIAHRYKAIYLAGIMSYFRPIPRMLGIAHEHRVFKRITRKLFVTFWRKQFLVAGVSQSVVNDIAKTCPSLVSEGRLHQLPNVLPREFEASLVSREEARQKLGLSPDSIIVGSIGRLVKKKSINLLLQAFKEVAKPNAELVLVGDGPLRAQLEDLAIELSIENRVKFLGYVSGAGKYVRLFDVFVLPSGSAEAFGIVLLEAMIAGVPVIASSAPGPAEVVGVSARLFNDGDAEDLARAIQELLAQDSEHRTKMLDQNRERVQQVYSPQVFADKLEALLAAKTD